MAANFEAKFKKSIEIKKQEEETNQKLKQFLISANIKHKHESAKCNEQSKTPVEKNKSGSISDIQKQE